MPDVKLGSGAISAYLGSDQVSLSLGSAAVLHHPEALAWQAAVIENGGSVSGTELNAVDRLVKSIYTAGIRDRFLRYNPFVGGYLGALVPLFRGPVFGGTTYGNATDTADSFVEGDYGLTTGLQGAAASSKRLRCGASILSNATAANAHCMIRGSSLDAGSVSDRLAIGATSVYPTGLLAIQTRESSDTRTSFFCNSISRADGPSKYTSGMLVGSVISATDLKFYHNGVSVGSTAVNRGTSALTANEPVVFAWNNNGTIANHTSALLTCYSFGFGMTAAQVAAFTTAVEAFHTAIGRA